MITIDSFNIKQELFEGDLCYIDGYGKRIWEVIGLTKMKTQIHGAEKEDLTYYLRCILTGEEIMGMQEDSVLICRSKDAFSFIRDYYGNIPVTEFNFEDEESKEESIDYDSVWERVDVTDLANSIQKAPEVDIGALEVDITALFEEIIRKGEGTMTNNNDSRRLTAAEIRKKRDREPSYKYPDTVDGLLDRLIDLESEKDVYENVLKESVDEDLLLEIELIHEELEEKRKEMLER